MDSPRFTWGSRHPNLWKNGLRFFPRHPVHGSNRIRTQFMALKGTQRMPRRIRGASGGIFSKKKKTFFEQLCPWIRQKRCFFLHGRIRPYSCSSSDFAAECCFLTVFLKSLKLKISGHIVQNLIFQIFTTTCTSLFTCPLTLEKKISKNDQICLQLNLSQSTWQAANFEKSLVMMWFLRYK